MMGWRVGYIAFFDCQIAPNGTKWCLKPEILKIQDSIPICAPVVSQRMAIGALGAGKQWVEKKLVTVASNRQMLKQAITEVLGKGSIVGGDGAIYVFAALPPPSAPINGVPYDEQVCKFLVEEYGVAVIPGSACGAPNFIRVSYANLEPQQFAIGVERLQNGLSNLHKLSIN